MITAQIARIQAAAMMAAGRGEGLIIRDQVENLNAVSLQVSAMLMQLIPLRRVRFIPGGVNPLQL